MVRLQDVTSLKNVLLYNGDKDVSRCSVRFSEAQEENRRDDNFNLNQLQIPVLALHEKRNI